MSKGNMKQIEVHLTKDLINKYINRFNENEGSKEDVLKWLFEKYKGNRNFNEVLTKVTVLNSLYSAGLYNNQVIKNNKLVPIDVVSMSERIINQPKFDEWLNSEKEDVQINAYYCLAVEDDPIFKSPKAFASKYCSWHQSDRFPIYDSLAKGTLYRVFKTSANKLNREDITIEKLSDYTSFCEIYKIFLTYVKKEFDESYDIKKIDKFLWQYGKEHPEVVIS